MVKPVLHYFNVRGRGEPIKLALAAKDVDFEVVPVDYNNMKQDLQSFPFAQAPRYVDDEVDICQSNAICRYIGRRYGLYGSNRSEAAQIDQIMDGVEDLRIKYVHLIYKDQLAADAKAAYWASHCDPSSAHGSTGGAHFAYLCNLLKRNQGGEGFAVGSALSIADIQLFDLMDLHLRIFQRELQSAYPELVGHHGRVGATPGIKAYCKGPKRVAAVNGNNLG